MSRKPRISVSKDRSRILMEGDLETARSVVAGATLCDGMQASIAVELEVDYLQCVGILDSSLPGTQRTVLAYCLETQEPYPVVARLALERFSEQELVRIETFRRLPGRWSPMGNVALGLAASRAIASAMLQRAPAPSEEGDVQ